MNQQPPVPPTTHQDYLSTTPPEILDEIFGYILQVHDQQVLPHPYMRVSKAIGQHVAGMLTKNCTLQVECRHSASHHFWATSMYRSRAKGEYLHAPRLPCTKGSVVRWSEFCRLVLCAEMLENVDSLYVKFFWMREMAFTIFFHRNQPPTIKTHAWFHSRDPTVPQPLYPDMVRWIQQPAVCSVEWIEAFIGDMRNQCDAHVSQYCFSREHYLHKVALGEMACLQPWKNYAMVLRPVRRLYNKPIVLRLTKAHSLRSSFISQYHRRRKAELDREKQLDERFRRFQLLKRRGRSQSAPVCGRLSNTRTRSTSI